MANLNKSKTIFAFTSPRTIEKIIPEIQILVNGYEGKKWDNDTQKSFFSDLFESEFYEGKEKPKDITFAARDRITRAPKALGFVDLKPVIKLTEVGQQLLSGKRINEVIARQLLKFQLPSPYHKVPEERGFNVRPYLELLRIVKVIGNISKTEIAIFFVQLTNYKKFDEIVQAIRRYRVDYSAHTGNKKAFIDLIFTKEVLKIYEEDIKNEKFKGRQDNDTTLQDFVARKKSNHVDYADALVRYLRATQLITFDKNFRIIIAPSRNAEVDFILQNIERKALSFKNGKTFKTYLFSPNTLELLTDKRENVEKQLDKIGAGYDEKATVEDLKDLLEKTETDRVNQAIAQTEKGLKDYKEFDDILSIFDKIDEKIVPDPSLYLEWNIWRSMVMVNYAKKVQGNFKLDLDGVPLNTAGAKIPDIEIDYESFKMIVEVTMSSGQKQYDMEGEPVPRHFGNAKSLTDKPVYCLFIAPKISEGTLAHFFALNQKAPKFYGGQTNIVPMNLENFRQFITTAKNSNFNNPNNLQGYLDNLLKQNRTIDDEAEWFRNIERSVSQWI